MRTILIGVTLLAVASLTACKKQEAVTNDVAAEGPAAPDENMVATVNDANAMNNAEADNSGSTDHEL
jgi:hypothetical protein